MSSDEQVPVSADPGLSVAGLRVLVADDTFITQAMMKTRLTKLGCEVSVADNGEAAVEQVRQKPFDCIFMDYHMPIVDGVEATKRIREWEATSGALAEGRPKMYIVAFTATSQNSDRKILTEAGMDDFLTKPMTVDELLMVLRRAKGRK